MLIFKLYRAYRDGGFGIIDSIRLAWWWKSIFGKFDLGQLQELEDWMKTELKQESANGEKAV